MVEKFFCKVRDSSSSLKTDFFFISCDSKIYFIDTSGLDEKELILKNMEKIMKFRNAFQRINTFIYCQNLDDNRFSQSAKILFHLMNELYPDSYLFKNLIIVRTKSDRRYIDFEENKKASVYLIKSIKEEDKIDEKIEIKQYYIDSKYQDKESIIEKEKIFDLISKKGFKFN